MNKLSLPFTIVSANTEDFVLEKFHKKNREFYHLRIPDEKKLQKPIIIRFEGPPQNLEIELQIELGKGAEAVVKMLAEVSGAQTLSLNAQLSCDARSKGELLMKGVTRDRSRLNFDGLVHIGKKGAGSSGYLKQEILNLSRTASVRAEPALNIETNDVKAGHSASIRNLNDEELYYFAARGIKSEMAKKLLVAGFMKA